MSDTLSLDAPLDRRICTQLRTPGPAQTAAALKLVKRLYAIRRQRDRAFGAAAEVFRDPAWDMMLDLFAARIEGRQTGISSAALAACIPQTTAIRLVDALVARKLLKRVADRHDGRRSLLELTPAATDMIWRFLVTLGDEDALAEVGDEMAARRRGRRAPQKSN